MTASTTLTIRLSPEVQDELARLAASTGRSQGNLAAEAVAAYVAVQRWQVAGIEAAIAEADAGGPAADQAAIEAWVRSWGSEREERPPVPD